MYYNYSVEVLSLPECLNVGLCAVAKWRPKNTGRDPNYSINRKHKNTLRSTPVVS